MLPQPRRTSFSVPVGERLAAAPRSPRPPPFSRQDPGRRAAPTKARSDFPASAPNDGPREGPNHEVSCCCAPPLAAALGRAPPRHLLLPRANQATPAPTADPAQRLRSDVCSGGQWFADFYCKFHAAVTSVCLAKSSVVFIILSL